MRPATTINSIGNVTSSTTQARASIDVVRFAAPMPRSKPCQMANNTQHTVINSRIRFSVNRGRQFGGINGGGSGSGV